VPMPLGDLRSCLFATCCWSPVFYYNSDVGGVYLSISDHVLLHLGTMIWRKSEPTCWILMDISDRGLKSETGLSRTKIVSSRIIVMYVDNYISSKILKVFNISFLHSSIR
jgi:hypothetical protein